MPSHSLNSIVPIQLERLDPVEGTGFFCLSRMSIELFAQSDGTHLVQPPQPINGNSQERLRLGLSQLITAPLEPQDAEVSEVMFVVSALVVVNHKVGETVSM